MDNYREKAKRTLASAKVSENESEVLEEIRKLSQDIKRNLMENKEILDEVMIQVNELKTIDGIIQERYMSQVKAKENVFTPKERVLKSKLTWEQCAEDTLSTLEPFFEDIDETEDAFSLNHFREIVGLYDNIKPTIFGEANSSDVGVVCMGEQVNLSVRQGAVEERDIEECLEYIKLANYYNEKENRENRFKVRWMFLEKVNPSHVIGIEYLYHEEPIYSQKHIKSLFHDGWEIWSGIINTVQVKMTKVDMNSDYYFENGPEYSGMEGYN